MSAVTLKDVADAAGVSVATVSRALSVPDRVATATRERIQAIAKELGYRPSRVAQRLRTTDGVNHLIGVLIPDIQNPFFADIVRGVEAVAHRAGYSVLFHNVEEDPDRQRAALEALRTEHVDGVILPPVHGASEDIAALQADGLPVVCVDRRLVAEVDTVVAANEEAAREAVALLLRGGHRRIGMIGGDAAISTSRERLAGYRRAHEDAGLEVDATLIAEADGRMEGGRAAAAALLSRGDRPTALFTANNLMTLGALSAIHASGLRIPEDVAIVGYDDMPWAMALNPPLTAVRQPGEEMGRIAADLLLARIEAPDRAPTLTVLQPSLVVRRSCGSCG
ncbi:MAG TPA: LacI family transcriptional regulator [Bacteroidetes bacterium]|nr:LacI family transcriptional regulator [Bacteroidota bacterium]HIL57224.1 LacI family transcriptional regulator [Rhodothermales bacterium]